MRYLILIAIAGSLMAAEPAASTVSGSDWRTAYRWSVASLVATTTMDAVSSAGLTERNPLLRSADGGYGKRGVALKAGITAGVLASQYFVLRKHPERRKLAAVVNFATSAGFAVIASRNFRVQ